MSNEEHAAAFDPPEKPGVFVTTHWSVVVQARGADTTQAGKALEQLCRVYWYPLYVYVRRRGKSPHDAQDLTQEFFARLLQGKWVARADPNRGRFRTFLLTAMERFLANEWDKDHALKRGGGSTTLPLEWETAETRFVAEPAGGQTPQEAFERRWALTLLEQVLRRLEAEQADEGQAQQFAALSQCLVGDRESLPYGEIARRMTLSEGAVKVAVHRLRQRYRELLRAEVANTLASEEEVDAEMRHLFNVLAGG
jgi:RNA polymerase sigma factor (sigma-70 family)